MAKTENTTEDTPAQDAPAPTEDTRDVNLTTDDDGSLIDPPVLPEYESRLRAAHDLADQEEIDAITAEYNDARVDRARVLAARERDREVTP